MGMVLIQLFLNRMKRAARKAVRKTALGAAAAICALVALGFFTAAGFLWLSATLDPVAAAAIVGGIYLAFAVLAIILAGNDRTDEPEPAPVVWSSLAEAFLAGLATTRKKK